MMMRNGMAILAVAVGLGGQAQAGSLEDIRIDLSTLVSSTGGNWNDISDLNGVTSDLIDFNTGASTGASIEGAGWLDFFGDDNGEFPEQDWVIQPSTVDGAGLSSDGTGTFEIDGLSGSAYIVELVSARTSFEYLNTFTVNGALADETFLGSAVNTPWNSTTDGLEAGNWLIWNNVQPVDGSISIMDVAGPGTLGILNAVRISEVPSPGAVGVLGIAGIVAGVRRRR